MAATGEDPLTRLGEQLRSIARDVDGALRRVRVAVGDAAVEVEWSNDVAEVASATRTSPGDRSVIGGSPAAPHPAPHAESPGDRTDDGHAVVSPMVGTFYASPAPGEPAFVAVGQRVEVGQTVGIVEAMKLLNPIESDVAGDVIAICAADGHPVEFCQPLVRVLPTQVEV